MTLTAKTCVLSAICILFSFGVNSKAYSEPVQHEGDLLQRAQSNALRKVQEDMGVPEPGGQYGTVIASLGSSVGRIVAVLPPKYDAKGVAASLEVWGLEQQLPDVKASYSVQEKYSVAQLTWSKGELFRSERSQRYAIDRLFEVLNRSNLNMAVVAVLQKHYIHNVTGTPGTESRTANYYLLDRQLHSSVKVQLKYNPGVIAMVAVFLLAVPVMCGLGILIAIRVASNERIELARRRRLYSKWALYPTFGSIAVHAPFAFFMITGPHLKSISELWLGTARATTLAAPFLMLPLVFMLPALMVIGKVEKKLFRDTGPTEEPTVDEKRAEELAKEYPRMLRPYMLGALAVFIVTRFPFVGGDAGMVIRVTGMVAALAVFLYGNRAVRKKFSSMVANEGSKSLEPKVQEIGKRVAASMNTTIKAFDIDYLPVFGGAITAWAMPFSRVRVSQRAAKDLDDDELAFLIAHEVAHVKFGHLRKRFFLIFLPPLMFVLPLFLSLAGFMGPVSSSGLYFAIIMLSFMHVFITSKWIMRRFELEADREAVRATGNLGASERALQKMVASSPLPGMAEIDDLSTHPALSNRIRNLRLASAELL